MRIVLTGGGTGGHIYPALAVAREALRRDPGTAFLYVGTASGLESRLVPRDLMAFETIDISGLKRKLTIENVRTAWKFVRSVSRAREILRGFRPDVVLGTGGYVCAPVVYAAARMGIPAVIHEQNVVPGLTNRFLARFADRIAVSFEESLVHFPPSKTVVTGNPRATEVQYGRPEAARETLGLPVDKRVVVIVGGSRGARPINQAAMALLASAEQYAGCHFVFVTGEIHYDAISRQLQESGRMPANLTLLPYVHNMPDLLAATRVIVNRAGASTLAEITSLGVPSVLIPSPYVTNNHQEKNARGLERQGAAVVLTEAELTGESLGRAVESLLTDDEKWRRMQEASKRLGVPDAAERVLALLREAAAGRKP